MKFKHKNKLGKKNWIKVENESWKIPKVPKLNFVTKYKYKWNFVWEWNLGRKLY